MVLPSGYTSLTPHLACLPANAAITFYTEVFGATVVSRHDGPDGSVAHAVLQLASGSFTVSDPAPAFSLVAPDGSDVTDLSLALYVNDCDAVTAAAAERGAVVREHPQDFVTGDRFASIRDPFGHRWAIMTRVADVSSEEAAERVDEWLTQQE